MLLCRNFEIDIIHTLKSENELSCSGKILDIFHVCVRWLWMESSISYILYQLRLTHIRSINI